MDEVEIHVVEPQPAEAFIERPQGFVKAVIGIGELRCDEKLVPRKVSGRDRLTNPFLVAVDGRGIDQPVAGLDRVPDDMRRLVVGNLPDAQAELRHGPAVVQGQYRLGGHARHLRCRFKARARPLRPDRSGLRGAYSGFGLRKSHRASDMLTPKLKCLPLLVRIGSSIVDARHTSLVARHVVQHSLHHMRQHAKPGHSYCDSPPDVVEAPRPHRRSG